MNIISAFTVIITTSVMGSIVACVVMLIKKIFKNKLSTTWHYYIWLLVIFRFLMPYSIDSSFSIFNVFNFSTQQVKISQPTAKADVSNFNSAQQVKEDSPIITLSKAKSNEKIENVKNHSAVLYTKTKTLLSTSLLSIFWIIGMAIIALFILVSYIIFSFKISRDYLINDKETIDIFNECKKIIGIKGYIPILCSKNVTTPTLFGIIKPKIIISPEVIIKLDSNEKKYIFFHELVHIKRKDILLNWIITLLLIVHWFNPILWICFSRMKKDCEISCDSTTLTYLNPVEFRAYGETLLKLINFLQKTNWTPGTAAIINKCEIKRRIIMISKFKKNSLLWSIVAIFLTLAIGCTGLTNGKNNIESNKDKIQLSSKNESNIPNSSDTKNNQSTEKTNTAKNPLDNSATSPPKISDEQLKILIHNGDMSVRKIDSLRKPNSYIRIELKEFDNVKEDFTDSDSLTQYANEKLCLSSYFSNEFTGKFINFAFKKINGVYYIIRGNFSISPIIKEISLKKYEENKLYINFIVTYAFSSDSFNKTATLIYNNGKWVIDKMDIWGIPDLDQ